MATHFIVTPVASPGIMLRAVVAATEPSTRRAILHVLANDPAIHLVKECGDAASARQAIVQERPEILFVDVDLPDASGFELVRSSSSVPAVIFLGTLGHHAAQAFEVRAVDYLVQPFSQERLLEALRRAKLKVQSGIDEHRSLSARPYSERRRDAPQLNGGFLERITLKSGNTRLVHKIESIEYFTAAANYILVSVNSETFRIRARMGEFEKRLDPRQFLRIHRGTIINLEFLREFRLRTRGGYIVKMSSGKELQLSRRYSRKFLEALSSLKYGMQ